jgi:3',5'-cyclic-AMP phosphodiesterase
MLLAQFSDSHIRLPDPARRDLADTAALTRACIAHLLRQDPAPDWLLLTGDLAESGRDEEYALLRELLEPLPCPLLAIPGNHDRRAALRRHFPPPAGAQLMVHAEFMQFACDAGELRLIALDTVVAGQPHGELCGERLDWLAEQLQADERPAVVLMHHPPFATGIAHMDAMRLLRGAAELEALLARQPQVQALLCGHLHRPIQTCFGGRLALTAPGTAHQIALDLRPDSPDCFVLEPPGYLLHLWRDGRLLSHQAVVGDFAGPYRFDLF